MKFVLIFQICSMAMGYCYPPLTDREVVDSWSQCVEKGMEKTALLISNDRDAFDINKYVVRIYCKAHEDNSNKIPTSSQ